jgi:flagellar protein FliO/FliZ
MPGPTDSARSTSFRPSPILIGAGILVVALGFGLPKLFSASNTAPSTSETKAASTSADSLTTPVVESTSERPNIGMALARLIGGLVIVCGLCVALTRWMSNRKPVPTGTMEVLASLSIDIRNAIHLVRAGDRRLLIGTDISGVKALVELPGRLPDLLPETPPKPTTPGVGTRSAPEPSVVLGPVPVTMPSTSANRDEILLMLARLRGSLESPPKT